MIYSSVELCSIYEDLIFWHHFNWDTVGHFIFRWHQSLKPRFRPVVPSHWQMPKKNKIWAILLTDQLIPHAGLYFCAFGPWQLLYCPMLWRHSRRLCFIYICLSKSFRRKLQTLVSAKDKVTQCYSKLCVVMLKFNYFNLLWICCTPCVQQQIKSL